MAELPSGGAFSGRIHYYPLRVYFEDTDLSGVVYHANYLRFMERARTEMLRAVGIEQGASIAAGGAFYAIHEVAVTFRAPARLDDILVVASRVEGVRAATTTLIHEVWRGQQQLTEGRVTAAWIGPNGRPQRQPAAWIARFRSLLADPPGDA